MVLGGGRPAGHGGLAGRVNPRGVTLTLSGRAPAGPVLFQLPAFVNNIAHASAGTVNESTGTVTLDPSVRSVSVQLKKAAS